MAQIIQWFPGHMAKAFRLMRENLKLVDVIFELVDARIPESSRNPEVDKLIGSKPRLLIMTKADLADPEQIRAWKARFESEGHTVLVLDTRDPRTPQLVTKAARRAVASKKAAQIARGIQDQPIRAMITGIPNVGKSTLLNHLVMKNVAPTADRPGVTKKIAWLKTPTKLDLLDSPGVLWPKFEDQVIGMKLALTGAVKDTIFAKDDAALFLIGFFRNYRPESIVERYHLTEDIFDKENVQILLEITNKLGFKDNYEKASERLLNDLRKGKLGTFTLDLIVATDD
ncbi:MAG: ribosome biogenesis GTPase YlqF [Leuconostoc gelidum]|jgi:ribosome biogenesis GTPase A|uniref:ribosome biogenesis GTPase YlqF n=1 Tax=Leuconostoc gelidum group TaxID=3016637 RepID=UPI00021937C3|nr:MULTISPECIES: ribosome biogenesis GTPase YlqF [Leuconostoc gelidum group]AFS40353.1 GTP-binding protein RbgA [Leuconostoc gelidum JB7]MBZ5960851.1 ribosome biogenesis GTPase YlqF [Leuconostoc gasicomitatum]MBZ5978242.1 ribosome biogenesis GTPase YlqF [Leuconostoc gelidum subsp. gelidum]MBZ5991277.1 ribosome biogenesis GTPase YlqF [Leuconostoc gelidum subsp. gelidum]MBZ5994701.1 ribosome biogenesis GTPase YlqF [Leuconostoc gasicomitatum]